MYDNIYIRMYVNMYTYVKKHAAHHVQYVMHRATAAATSATSGQHVCYDSLYNMCYITPLLLQQARSDWPLHCGLP
jgi:hypothetical protein